MSKLPADDEPRPAMSGIGTTHLPVGAAVRLGDEAIREQIRSRRRLMGAMVGDLYPSILEDEIHVLEAELRRREPDRM